MKLFSSLLLLFALSFLPACTTEREYTADPYANYDQLWETLDRGYCYFDLKLPKGTTWRDLYHKYRRSLSPKMTSTSSLPSTTVATGSGVAKVRALMTRCCKGCT